MEPWIVLVDFVSLGLAATGVIGLAVTFYFRRNPRRGNLTFSLIDVTRFHEMAGNIQKSLNLPKSGDLKIILDTNNNEQSGQSSTQDLTDATVLNYRIKNTSRVPVQSNEIQKLALQASEDLTILAAYPTDKDPENLEFSVTTNDSDGCVELDLKGLDKGEWVKFEVLVEGDFSQDNVEIQERTVGVDVKEPREIEGIDNARSSIKTTSLILDIIAGLVVSVVISSLIVEKILQINFPLSINLWALLTMFIVVFFAFYFTLKFQLRHYIY